jgi:hypothetical protein
MSLPQDQIPKRAAQFYLLAHSHFSADHRRLTCPDPALVFQD